MDRIFFSSSLSKEERSVSIVSTVSMVMFFRFTDHLSIFV